MLLVSAPSPEKRLNLSDTFNFSCHSGLACFNRCCRSKHLPLTPYDMLRLKTALDLHSDEFLSAYTLYMLDPDSGFPVLSLKMEDGPEKPCPFVGPRGCTVYDDRPTACRLYPLGRAAGARRGRGIFDEFYFQLDTPGCLGIKEDTAWSVGSWRENQGLTPYVEMNDRMLEIVFHPRRNRKIPLNDAQLQKLMVACYNLDLFREFVIKTPFLELYEIDEDTRTRIGHDDHALLNLAFNYLERALFP
jgi:uncharacterized protein